MIDRPVLDRLWDQVAERLQRNGLQARGRLTLDGLGRDERHALAGLLGRPVAAERVTVDLALLDQRLRAGGADGLVAAAHRLRGPLVDRPGVREDRAAARARLWAAGYTALDQAGLSSAPWIEPWFEDLRRAGTLARVPSGRGEATLTAAVACLRQLPLVVGAASAGHEAARGDMALLVAGDASARHAAGRSDVALLVAGDASAADAVAGGVGASLLTVDAGATRPMARGDLASLVTGDAHGLDDSTVLAAAVLRAVAVITGQPYPSTPAGRRALWRAAGVFTDEVSTTVLTMGLRTATGDAALDDRSTAGWETHLTGRDLRRVDIVSPADGAVFVCENPRVLDAALDAGSRRAVVCTQGQPVVVVTALLERLATAGADLRYHGDYDWPGITIANVLTGTVGCRPWRFGAADYVSALGRLAPAVAELPVLRGHPVTASWDPELTTEMTRAGRAIHEELVLADLLADLY